MYTAIVLICVTCNSAFIKAVMIYFSVPPFCAAPFSKILTPKATRGAVLFNFRSTNNITQRASLGTLTSLTHLGTLRTHLSPRNNSPEIIDKTETARRVDLMLVPRKSTNKLFMTYFYRPYTIAPIQKITREGEYKRIVRRNVLWQKIDARNNFSICNSPGQSFALIFFVDFSYNSYIFENYHRRVPFTFLRSE